MLSTALDDMLSDKAPQFEENKETLISKLNLKLRRLYDILQGKTEESLHDKEKMQSLISDISHQVKTPVANLKMYNEILSERKLTGDKQKEFLNLSRMQINKLDFLMQSLVKMSRLENGIISFCTDKIPVQSLLVEGLSGIMPAAERKNIEVSVECQEDIYALCDKKWTCEAIFNILDNAVKYTPENGMVRVSVTVNGFYTVISVKDSGAGIPEAEQPLIFERFYRSGAVRDINGLGIGLFLSRKIISEQGGYIQVKSEPPDGAEFIVCLKNK